VWEKHYPCLHGRLESIDHSLKLCKKKSSASPRYHANGLCDFLCKGQRRGRIIDGGVDILHVPLPNDTPSFSSIRLPVLLHLPLLFDPAGYFFCHSLHSVRCGNCTRTEDLHPPHPPGSAQFCKPRRVRCEMWRISTTGTKLTVIGSLDCSLKRNISEVCQHLGWDVPEVRTERTHHRLR
jgi:hypothetical protein